MLGKFLSSTSEGLAKKSLEWLFGPAFAFWAGGLILVSGPKNMVQHWSTLTAQPAPIQGVLVLAAAVLLAGSTALMHSLRLPLLRFLEGYWFWPLRLLEEPRMRAWQRRIRRQRQEWSTLVLKKEDGHLTFREQRRLAHLEQSRVGMPRDMADVMPTRLGNILRTAETRPWQRYGLDAVLLWPRLWLLLPEDICKQLTAARAQMDKQAESWGWGLLFIGWVFGNYWALAIAVAWMALSYALLVQRTQTFAELVLAVFDTQRWRLFEALHWPLPGESGQKEITAGEALTRFVQRGPMGAPVRYASKPDKQTGGSSR